MTKARRTVLCAAPGGRHDRRFTDGKYLSFIRRVGLKTALFLREIESDANGQFTIIYRAITRDLGNFRNISGLRLDTRRKFNCHYGQGKSSVLMFNKTSGRRFLSRRTSHSGLPKPLRFQQKVAPYATPQNYYVGERNGNRIIYMPSAKFM